MRILFCGATFPDAAEFLRQRLQHNGDEIVVCPEEDIRPMLAGVDVIIPKMKRIDRHLMESGGFRLIQQWGAGLEGIDLEVARERKIWVSHVPAAGGNAESVAEHAILLMLSLLRNLTVAQSNVRSGVLGSPLGKMLAGQTVCLYGLGAIALALAKRLSSFGVRLIGITRDPLSPKVREFGLEHCFSVRERERGLAETNVLVLCLRYFEEMRGTIGAHELACLPRGAYLVNVARGGLVNYEALYGALRSGQLGGAAMDMFWEEPIAANDPILELPNVIATPHIGAVTPDSFSSIADAVATNIERLRRGEAPLNRVV